METNVLAERIDNLVQKVSENHKALIDHMNREELSDEKIGISLAEIKAAAENKVGWTVILSICGGFLTVLAYMFLTYHQHDIDDSKFQDKINNSQQSVSDKLDALTNTLNFNYTIVKPRK